MSTQTTTPSTQMTTIPTDADLIRRVREDHFEDAHVNGLCICGYGFPCDARQLADALEQTYRSLNDQVDMCHDLSIKLEQLQASHRAELEQTYRSLNDQIDMCHDLSAKLEQSAASHRPEPKR